MQPEWYRKSAQSKQSRAATDGDLASGRGWHKLEGEGQAKNAAALALRQYPEGALRGTERPPPLEGVTENGASPLRWLQAGEGFPPQLRYPNQEEPGVLLVIRSKVSSSTLS